MYIDKHLSYIIIISLETTFNRKNFIWLLGFNFHTLAWQLNFFMHILLIWYRTGILLLKKNQYAIFILAQLFDNHGMMVWYFNFHLGQRTCNSLKIQSLTSLDTSYFLLFHIYLDIKLLHRPTKNVLTLMCSHGKVLGSMLWTCCSKFGLDVARCIGSKQAQHITMYS